MADSIDDIGPGDILICTQGYKGLLYRSRYEVVSINDNSYWQEPNTITVQNISIVQMPIIIDYSGLDHFETRQHRIKRITKEMLDGL